MFASTSLNGILGHSALIVGLISSLFGAFALITAIRTGNRVILRGVHRYALLCLGAAIAAFVVMERALITRDFGLSYVQHVGSTSTPALFNVTALWSALEGSILLWVLVLAGYTAAVMRKYRKRLDDPLVAWAMVVMFVVSAFFFFLSFGPTDAFKGAAEPDFTR
jgi:cytochrome c-type biogenesis protein CcmF